jgi:hypothetical protein
MFYLEKQQFSQFLDKKQFSLIHCFVLQEKGISKDSAGKQNSEHQCWLLWP